MNCRLLYLVGGLGTGGLERQLYYLLKTMNRDLYQPEVVVWSFRNEDTYVPLLRELGVRLHSFPNTRTGIQKLAAFRSTVRRIKPEVLHSYSFYTNFAAWWAAQGTNTVAIGSSRSDVTFDKKDSGLLLGNLSARWPRHQIYNSFRAATTASRSHTPFIPKRVSVVRNGVDLDSFRLVHLPNGGPVRILGVGSLLPLKRWDRLLKGAYNLKKRNLDFRLDIVGGGPLRRSLEKQAEDLRLVDRVTFLGHKNDIASALAASSFLTHTSDTEGCPNVIMEAMACGRAVVATDAGDVPSLVENDRTGFVVRRGDNEALEDRIARLVTDRDLSQRMGRAGREKAEREFGLDRLVAETLMVYRVAGWRDT